MRVNLPLVQLNRLLASMAQEAKDQARIDHGNQADAVILGISYLLGYWQESLNGMEEYDLSPEPQHNLMMKAVQKFCATWCESSSGGLAPGEHEHCTGCPLSMYTAGVIERVVKKVMET